MNVTMEAVSNKDFTAMSETQSPAPLTCGSELGHEEHPWGLHKNSLGILEPQYRPHTSVGSLRAADFEKHHTKSVSHIAPDLIESE